MTETGSSADLAPVWKALADPGRRRILDLLRQRPRTTSELARSFEHTRFATMKHLKVLHTAGLITVERRSRERINHLNPVPLQQIYRRFVQPFEAAPADGLLQLKALAEQGTENMSTSNEHPFRQTDIHLEVHIKAPRERVWAALTEEIGQWWPKNFTIGAAKRFVLEPKVGGRMFEEWEDGGLLWATVISMKKYERLDMAGDAMPEFGGAGRHLNTYTLEEKDGGTLVKLRSTAIGALTEGSEASMKEGWKLLFVDTFPAYCEGRKLPGPAIGN